MSSLHVGGNDIPEKAMREIMTIAAGKENMKVLCEVPFKDKTITELDVSGKDLGIEGALVVAEYLDGNGALLVLDISQNDLFADRIPGKGIQMNEAATDALMQALLTNKVLKSINISDTLLCGCPSSSRNSGAYTGTFNATALVKLCNLLRSNVSCSAIARSFQNHLYAHIYPYDFLFRTWGHYPLSIWQATTLGGAVSGRRKQRRQLNLATKSCLKGRN